MKNIFPPFFCLFFAAYIADAQTVTWSTPGCGTSNPTLQMVVFQGCTPNEGTKEFVHFTTGSNWWDISNLTIKGSQNATITPNAPCSLSGFSGNIAATHALNSIAGCSTPLFEAAPSSIPPNSKVLVIPNIAGALASPSYQNITAAQLAPLCGRGPIYVVGNTPPPGCTQGIFANINPACLSNCNRNIIINFGSGCVATINYDINDPAMPSPTAGGVNFTPSCNITGAIINAPNTCFPLSSSILPKWKHNYNKICTDSLVILSLNEPYATYQWSTGATSASILGTAGSAYSVTVSNSVGCTGVATTIVQTFPPFSVMITGSDKICSGNTVTLSAGTLGYKYQWNSGENTPTIQVANPSTYSVTVTDQNGCTAVAKKTLTLAANALTHFKKVICKGETCYFDKQYLTKSGTYTAIFPAFNTCDSTVVLNLDILPTDTMRLQKTLCSGIPGTFVDVLKKYNGCDSVLITTIDIATKLNVAISEQNKVLTINSVLSGVTYQWMLNEKAIVGANSAAFTAFVDGLYYVEITDANGCKHKSNIIQIGQVATNDVTRDNIRIYPNPTTGLCYVQTNEDFNLEKLMIENLLGQKQILQVIDNQIDISIFPNGLYQLMLQNKEGKIFCAKLIKQ